LNKRFNGSAHVLGPVFTGGDHLFIYYAPQHIQRSTVNRPLRKQKRSRTTLEIQMSKLDTNAMSNFYRNEKFIDAKTTTRTTGLATILPNMITDEIMFEPCGYSVNAINSSDASYFTVHVTPEPHCSFVSFETNAELVLEKKLELIRNVSEIFKPGRFSIIISGFHKLTLGDIGVEGFVSKFKTQYEYEEGFYVLMSNYASLGHSGTLFAA